jgi:hypothetical protein
MVSNMEDTNKNKKKIFPMRLDDEEWNMVIALKSHPYYVNMAQYLRNCIRHLHQSKFNKAGRVNKSEITNPPVS